MNRWPKQSSSFRDDERGGILIMFALVILPMMMIIGLALDSGRAFATRMEISAALDGAAYVAAQEMFKDNLSEAEIAELAQSFFDANTAGARQHGAAIEPLKFKADWNRDRAVLSASATIEPIFGKILKAEALTVREYAEAAYSKRSLEVSFALDLSGAMDSQMNYLPAALSQFMAGLSGGSTRFGLAPYGDAVNAGVFADPATDGASGDCVTERTGAPAFQDLAPGVGSYLGSKSTDCPEAVVEPLTNDLTTLNARLAALKSKGQSAGHLGLGWGWYTLSRDWGGVWPAGSEPGAYNDPTVSKTIVVIAGKKFDKSYEPLNGTADEQAATLCDEIRAVGVSIFVIAFKAKVKDELGALETCAGAGSNYFPVRDEIELRAALAQISSRLSQVRMAS